MKRTIFYLVVILLMIVDTVIVLRQGGLSRSDGVNLLLDGYAVGACAVLLLAPRVGSQGNSV